MRPNKDRIRLFVAALRFGKYPQTSGVLHRVSSTRDGQNPGFCCLGVACEVALENGLDLTKDRFGRYSVVEVYGKRREQSFLPDEVRDWFGFDSNDPSLLLTAKNERKFVWWRLFWQPKPRTVPSNTVRAVTANDLLKLSFSDMADAFERTYLSKEV